MWGYDHPRVAELVLANAREYAIIIIGEDGRLASWSPGAERVFGYPAAEVLGEAFNLLFLPADIAAGAPEQELVTARAQGRAEDSRWHVRKAGVRFWGNGVTMRLEEGDVGGFLKIVRDETAAKQAEERRILLLNELNHRIKNTLTTVQSIADQTLRAGDVDAAVRSRLTDRLLALSQAHDVLVQESWAGAELRVIVEQAVAVHQGVDGEVFAFDGPPVRLSPQQAVALSLVLHELATNALKHGALTRPSGRVGVTWNLSQDGQGQRYLTLLWTEAGGPSVTKPTRSGFGARLLAQSFGEGAGAARLDYHPDGLRCVIDVPLSGTEHPEILDLAQTDRPYPI